MLYTDGFIEVFNERREMPGVNGLRRVSELNRGEPNATARAAEEQKRLSEQIVQVVNSEVLPAYHRFAEFIAKDYAPDGRTTIGLNSLPEGARRYQQANPRANDYGYAPGGNSFPRPSRGCADQWTPDGSSQSNNATHYVFGTPDGSRPVRVVVATSSYAHRKLFADETRAYHEGIPGHHLQISIQQRVTGLPEFSSSRDQQRLCRGLGGLCGGAR